MAWLVGQSLINGILAGGVYSMIAVGVTIVFGVMRIINFASGAFMMLGMYYTLIAFNLIGTEVYFLLPFVILMAAAFGYIAFRLSIVPILNKERIAAVIATVGLSFFLQNVVQIFFGSIPVTIPSVMRGASFALGPFTITYVRVTIFFSALLFTILISLFVSKTFFGKCMRATSESAEIAEMLGINTRKMYIMAWTIGITLSAIAGLLITPMYMVDSGVGGLFRSVGLMAVVLGGLGDIRGAFIGGIALGVAEALVSALVAPDLGPAGMFVLFLVVLYFKPNGLFGKGERTA